MGREILVYSDVYGNDSESERASKRKKSCHMMEKLLNPRVLRQQQPEKGSLLI